MNGTMKKSLLDSAAEVRERRLALEIACQALRHVNGEWTAYAIAADDAMGIAHDGLRNAYIMLFRLHQLANLELDRIKLAKKHDHEK